MQIGLFQLKNLIQTRIPFFLISVPIDWDMGFAPHEIQLIKAQMTELPDLEFNLESVQKLIADRKLPVDFPVVLICQDGSRSISIAQHLSEGKGNCFYVADGATGLIQQFFEFPNEAKSGF